MINSIPTSLLSRIEEKRAEMARAQVAFTKELQETIGPVFQEFFDKYPMAEKIVWTQYAPYFNDGEPCEFCVHDAELFLVGAEIDEDYPEGEYAWSLKRMIGTATNNGDTVTQELYDDFVALSSLLQSDEEAMKTIFGSDSKITASRSGLDVDDYDHD